MRSVPLGNNSFEILSLIVLVKPKQNTISQLVIDEFPPVGTYKYVHELFHDSSDKGI